MNNTNSRSDVCGQRAWKLEIYEKNTVQYLDKCMGQRKFYEWVESSSSSSLFNDAFSASQTI
jgi:hypothetical protein